MDDERDDENLSRDILRNDFYAKYFFFITNLNIVNILKIYVKSFERKNIHLSMDLSYRMHIVHNIIKTETANGGVLQMICSRDVFTHNQLSAKENTFYRECRYLCSKKSPSEIFDQLPGS